MTEPIKVFVYNLDTKGRVDCGVELYEPLKMYNVVYLEHFLLRV